MGGAVIMTVWASSAGRSSRRFHRPARRGRNHNSNIWSKSLEHSQDLEGEGSPPRIGGWMLVTNPLVLEFQASVNKPFINFPALWKVSAQEVLTFCFLSLEMVSHSLPAAC